MRRIMIYAAISVLSVFYVFGFTVFAGEANGVKISIDIGDLDEPPDITADAAVLMDARTGGLIYEKNSGRIIYPASTVKIMTALIVLENVEDLESEVEISRTTVQNTAGNSLEPKAYTG